MRSGAASDPLLSTEFQLQDFVAFFAFPFLYVLTTMIEEGMMQMVCVWATE